MSQPTGTVVGLVLLVNVVTVGLGGLYVSAQSVTLLRVIVGLSVEETAEAVGTSFGAVRIDQHRGLRRLRKALPAARVV